MTKWTVERAMEVELPDHLGYEPHQEPAGGTGNPALPAWNTQNGRPATP